MSIEADSIAQAAADLSTRFGDRYILGDPLSVDVGDHSWVPGALSRPQKAASAVIAGSMVTAALLGPMALLRSSVSARAERANPPTAWIPPDDWFRDNTQIPPISWDAAGDAPLSQQILDGVGAASIESPALTDVRIYYCDQAMQTYGNIDGLMGRVDRDILYANQAFRNSQIGKVLRALPEPVFIPCHGSGIFGPNTLSWFRELPQVANDQEPDLKVYYAFGAGGVSYQMTVDFLGPQMSGFNQIIIGLSESQTEPRTLAHEVAHPGGAGHEGISSLSGAPDAHGYSPPSGNWKTIMALNCLLSANPYGPCEPVQYFSNPSLTINGEPGGLAGAADNARILNHTADIVAGFGHSTEPVRTKIKGTLLSAGIPASGAIVQINGLESVMSGPDGYFIIDSAPGSVRVHVVEKLDEDTWCMSEVAAETFLGNTTDLGTIETNGLPGRQCTQMSHRVFIPLVRR